MKRCKSCHDDVMTGCHAASYADGCLLCEVRRLYDALRDGTEIPPCPGDDPKPPLGIIPERLWKEGRVWDLVECLARHRNQQSIPSEWFDELRRLLGDPKSRR